MTTDDLVAGVQTVCDVVQGSLGPFGATRLLIQKEGNVTATASSRELLERLDVDDPAVTLLETTAEGFGDRHGDGSGTVLTLVGALLNEAQTLTDLGLHPTTIERGYREGLETALQTLDRTSRPLSSVGPAAVARTAMTGTRDPQVRRLVADRIAEAVETIGPRAHTDLTVFSQTGGASAETELVRGVVSERGPILDTMPRSATDGIAVLSDSVDVPHIGSVAGRVSKRVVLETDSYEDRRRIADRETEAFTEQLEAAIDAGCRVIFTEDSINERVQSALAAHGVLGIQRVDEDDLARIARATGATSVPSLKQIEEEALGSGTVEVQRKAGRDVTVVSSTAGEAVYTLFCRAPDPRSVTAFEDSLEAAIAATATAVEDERVVPGGGAVEATAARSVEEAARSIDDRHQLAAEAFGRALISVPRALAATAGVDAGRAVIRMRVARTEGRDAVGVDALAGEVTNVLVEDPIVEPTALKKAVFSAATDAAVQLIRIDEQLPAIDLSEEEIDPPEDIDMPTPEN
ncbi:TCP-1/cpn60 chaperonin family protein [Halopenitus sp. H-Gu1]|uniref:TCP-1/cpn60 chaperonin family protein n=1 Tax=Halopenitus sp. H-Gu1 TaxID=3242697 RepID=UPI00359E85F4